MYVFFFLHLNPSLSTRPHFHSHHHPPPIVIPPLFRPGSLMICPPAKITPALTFAGHVQVHPPAPSR